jgi:hypothetical protein
MSIESLLEETQKALEEEKVAHASRKRCGGIIKYPDVMQSHSSASVVRAAWRMWVDVWRVGVVAVGCRAVEGECKSRKL